MTPEQTALVDLQQKMAADFTRAIEHFQEMCRIAGVKGEHQLAAICETFCNGLVLFASACDVPLDAIIGHVSKDFHKLNGDAPGQKTEQNQQSPSH